MKGAIVVGAGVSGLAAAARLAKAGFSVEIFEKENQPGGRMGIIEKDSFQFDLGPTIVMMPDVYREVFTYCGRNPDDYIPMQRLDPIYNVYFADGDVHPASSELSKLVPTLESISYEETQGYLAYLADVYKRYLVAKDNFIQRTFDKSSDFWNPRTLAAGLKLRTFNNAYDSIGKFVHEEKLKELLSFQTLYIGVSPFNGPSIYTIIPMIELIYGVWFIKGGMHTMAKGLERLVGEMGGSIHYNAPVEKIEIQDGEAKGVWVAGKLHTADYVLCTADFPYALDALLPPDFKQGKYSKATLDKRKYSCSCLMMYLNLDKDSFPGLTVHSLAFSKDFRGNLDDIFEGKFPNDPSIYVYAPGILDKSLAPEGKLGLYVLVPVPNLQEGNTDWRDKATLDRIKEKVYEKIEQITPLRDVRNHVLAETFFTPNDFESKFNAYYGATFGLRPILSQSNHLRPQPVARKYRKLYFAGSSVHPGAGVPIVLTSAQLAAEKVIADGCSH